MANLYRRACLGEEALAELACLGIDSASDSHCLASSINLCAKSAKKLLEDYEVFGSSPSGGDTYDVDAHAVFVEERGFKLVLKRALQYIGSTVEGLDPAKWEEECSILLGEKYDPIPAHLMFSDYSEINTSEYLSTWEESLREWGSVSGVWSSPSMQKQYLYAEGDVYYELSECGNVICLYVVTENVPLSGSVRDKSVCLHCADTGFQKCEGYKRRKNPQAFYEVVEIGSRGNYVELPVPFLPEEAMYENPTSNCIPLPSPKPPTYSLSATPDQVNEGDVFTVTLETTHVAPGSTFFWSITGVGVDEEDFVDGGLTGSGKVDGDGKLVFTHLLSNDLANEGVETLIIKMFSNSSRTVQVGNTVTVTVDDTSSSPTYLLTVSPSLVNEGEEFTTTLSTSGVAPGTPFFWSISGAGITESDLSIVTPGPVTLTPSFEISDTHNTITFIDGPYVMGFRYSNDYRVKLSGVGIYKSSVLDHSVGIWDNTFPIPQLIWSNNYLSTDPYLDLPPDPTCSNLIFSEGFFRWHSVDSGPVLYPGRDYLIAATWDNEPVPFGLSPVDLCLPSLGTRLGGYCFTPDAVSGMLIDFASDPHSLPSFYSALGISLGIYSVNIAVTLDENPLSGQGVIGNDGKLLLHHLVNNDFTTEGGESLQIRMFSDSSRLNQVGNTATVSISDTSTPSTSSLKRLYTYNTSTPPTIQPYPGSPNLLGFAFSINRNMIARTVGIPKDTLLDHTVGIWTLLYDNGGNPSVELAYNFDILTTDTPISVDDHFKWYSLPDNVTFIPDLMYILASTWGEEPIPANVPETDILVGVSGSITNAYSYFSNPSNVQIPSMLIDLPSMPEVTPVQEISESDVGWLTVNLGLVEYVL